MNRMYQGKVIEVESYNAGQWGKMSKSEWQNILWHHHELFQDAVNYYTLMLATMAETCKSGDFEKKYLSLFNEPDEKSNAKAKIKAVADWSNEVRNNWTKGKKRFIEFDGPGLKISKLLNCKSDFDSCKKEISKLYNGDSKNMGLALLYLLDISRGRDLNKVCSEVLPFLCSKKECFNATSKDESEKQKIGRLPFIKKLHEENLDEEKLNKLSEEVNPYLFITKIPEDKKLEDSGESLAIKYFDDLSKKYDNIRQLRGEYEKRLREKIKGKPLKKLGRKPSGVFPCAVVFSYFPHRDIVAIFQKLTKSEFVRAKKSNKEGGKENTLQSIDYLNALRSSNNNQNPFEYFTNLVIANKKNNRASWFQMDLAAFIEAIIAPHRYFEDTQKRDEEAKEIKRKIDFFEGEGSLTKHSIQGDDKEEIVIPGFKDDKRVELIKDLLCNKLGYLTESEDGVSSGIREYSVSQRTLRGYKELRDKWLKLARQNLEQVELRLRLKKTLVELQSAHYDDFGSAPLFNALIEEKYQPIWRDEGTEQYHAKDVLYAWMNYSVLLLDYKDKTRPIHFTPAHSTFSPRYFDFPKDGEYSASHVKGLDVHGHMSLEVHLCVKNNGGTMPYIVKKIKITYSSPRMIRDALRHEGEENLGSVSWIQPMMKALGIKEYDNQNFDRTKVTLMPYAMDNIQLVFPVELKSENIQKKVSRGINWKGQFNFGHETINSLRWPNEEKPKNPPEKGWWDMLDSFSCLSVDLGQRNAGAYARLKISKKSDGKSRYIGFDGTNKWYSKVVDIGLLRLHGEDVKIWRKDDNGEFKYLEELSGSKGRKSLDYESKEAEALFLKLGFDVENSLAPNWKVDLSFPEQNDKLLVAVKRYQTYLSKLYRWAFFLGLGNKIGIAVNEIQEDSSIPDYWKKNIQSNKEAVLDEIKKEIEKRKRELPDILVSIANRILPLRGRSWKWERHPQNTDYGILTQNGSAPKNVLVCGQRGLSMSRLEQLTELRKRFQSMNHLLRRKTSEDFIISRDESIPDCCPDILEKLDRIKEERINQTAHMIIAKALGLRLSKPSENSKGNIGDHHGSYERQYEPVDFIVVENLSRYLSSQGRAPRENSRLMKWCHRAVIDKLKMFSEVFYPSIKVGKKNIPMVIEVPAAYSSRFCSRTGVAGFRAVEVSSGFENTAPWSWLKEKKNKDGSYTEMAVKIQEAKKLLKNMENLSGGNKKNTILLPISGGPIFIPITFETERDGLKPKIIQADVNAAVNIGLRAIASPEELSIHSRIRSKKIKNDIYANEKRFLGNESVKILNKNQGSSDEEEDRNPNYFIDISGKVQWGCAELEGKGIKVFSGEALWKTVRDLEWVVCAKINGEKVQ